MADIFDQVAAQQSPQQPQPQTRQSSITAPTQPQSKSQGDIFDQVAADQSASSADSSTGSSIATAPSGAPAGSMQAVPNEQTPEGHAAAVAQREAQHPIVTGLGEAAGDVWDTVKGMANPLNGGLAGATTQAYEHIKESIPIYQAYENARSSGKGIMDSLSAANDKAKQIHDAQDVVKQRVDEFKKNPTQATTRAVADAAALAATIWGGPEPLESPELSPELQAVREANAVPEKTGIVKKVLKGAEIAQPQAEAALRTGAKSYSFDPETGLSPIMDQPKSLRTSLEAPINSVSKSASDLYDKIDTAAGTDFKALNAKLENTEYQLRQLTDTEEDVAQEAKLEKSRTSIMSKIADAKQQAIKAGVDPKTLDQADAQFTQSRALRDVEAKVFKNQNVLKGNSAMGTPETINIDNAVTELQKLQDNKKFGAPRLEQALGKDGANKLLNDLYEAQREGKGAQVSQDAAKGVLKLIGLGFLGHEVLNALRPPPAAPGQ